MGVRMVDVGGYSLAVEDEGNGSPPIVFVAAMGTARSTWRRVVSDLAGIRTIVYDRAGIGDSDPRPERRGAYSLLADELGRLLDALGVTEPAVFVGHSIGSLTVRMLAHAQPGRFAGAVHVDGSIAHLILLPHTPGDHLDGERADSTEIISDVAAEEVLFATWPQVPGIVLVKTPGHYSDDPNPNMDALWQSSQRQLAQQITAAMIIAKDSGHHIQSERPDLVTFAVQAVVDAVHAGRSVVRPNPASVEQAGGIVIF